MAARVGSSGALIVPAGSTPTTKRANAEIAEQLHIQLNTGRRHSESVLRTLQINDRKDVVKALGRIPGSVLDRHGLEPPSGTTRSRSDRRCGLRCSRDGPSRACGSVRIDRRGTRRRVHVERDTQDELLVIDELRSRAWKHTSFGRKIQKAVELRADGRPLAILAEEHWASCL
jgi:hypothetical protein